MINLEIEKSLTLSAQERYDIIAFAMEAADDNGFINSFIFERALYCYASIILYPEHKDLLSAAIAKDLIRTWETIIENGLLEKMIEDYKDDLDQLATEGKIWYEEYSDWAHSARGILDMVQGFTGDIVQNAANRLTQTAEQTGVQQLLEVADDWGMTRGALNSISETNIENTDSLFQKVK